MEPEHTCALEARADRRLVFVVISALAPAMSPTVIRKRKDL